jgi:hypothetical protein
MRCPRCNGVIVQDGDGGCCLPCGWNGWPTPEAVSLRDQMRDEADKRRVRGATIGGVYERR